MSKLRERIREAGQRRPRSFGFVRRDEGPPTPRVLVVAEVRDGAGASAAVAAGAGAILFSGDRGQLATIVEAAKGAPVGVRLDGATRDDTKALVEAGGDFVIFDAAQTVAEALLERSLGRVLLAPSASNDDELRRYGALDLDAVLVGDPGAGLSVLGQLEMRRMAESTRAQLAVLLGASADTPALEVWRNAGAGMVIVPASRDDLEAIVAAAREVPPPPEPGQDERPTAVLAQARPAEHDDDDEDDD